MALACKEFFVAYLFSLILILSQTNLSKSTELFDLSELSRSQQNQLWTQVDNWAVAVVLANFCQRSTSLEERLLRIATRCITASSIKTVVDRFHAKMNSVKGMFGIVRIRPYKRLWEKPSLKQNRLSIRLRTLVRWDQSIASFCLSYNNEG